MCGINGIFNTTFAGDYSAKVQLMNSRLAHRGPDDEGIFQHPGIALGHRRLSIIDLSERGHQPMFTADKRYSIVFNGEIYNFREVRKLLNGKFNSDSDTEVVLAAWQKWGTGCLDKLNGMFAFAIYDAVEHALHLVRDRLGVKPLYYSVRENTISFSSEVRPIIAVADQRPEIDRDSLEDYLRYQTVHAPKTIIRGVQQLLPGHLMKITAQGMEVARWWQPKTSASGKVTREEALTRCRELLSKAVERRLVADVPFGAFLSGGIDSSAVVALMSRISDAPVKTFCVTFDESEFSESKFAQRIAELYKTEHHEIRLRPGDFLKSLPEALDALDHPSGDGINTYVVSKATKAAGITMALSGLGGDELFGGYDVFRRAKSISGYSWINRIPRGVRRILASAVRASGKSVKRDKLANILSMNRIDFRSSYPVVRQVLTDEQINRLLKNGIKSPNRVSEIIKSQKSIGDNHLFSCVSMAEIETYMQNVLLRDADQMSMASALEVRVPFLDFELVEYVLSLPDDLKFGDSPKQLLVDALRDLLPEEITNRKKMGFVFPWEHWMKNELKPVCEARLEWLGDNLNYMNKSAIMELWKSFLDGDQRVTWSRLWPLVVLSHWMQKNGIRG